MTYVVQPDAWNHSYRTFAFGAALGVLADIDVDRDLLFAAAMLHDTGLARPMNPVDFTLAGGPVAYLPSAGAGVDVVGFRGSTPDDPHGTEQERQKTDAVAIMTTLRG